MAQLKKAITLYGLTMVAIGACIGSGIFLTPAEIAGFLMDPEDILLVWGIGGVVTLTGALTFAELSAMFRRTGGVYVFLTKAFGPLAGFLFGWAVLLVITSGAIAALCLACAKYIGYFVPMSDDAQIGLAAGLIVVVTVVNIVGVRIAQLFSNLLTTTKLIGIAVVIFIGLLLGTSYLNFNPDYPITLPAKENAFALALIGVFWSYGGWHHASYLAGETINAKRTVPRAMLIGTALVTTVYLLTNLAYMFLLRIEDIAASKSLAADAIATVFPAGGLFIAVIIAISTFGTAGIYTLTAPRIYYAMAKDRVFFPALAKVHSKWRTPTGAIMLQSAWAIVLLLFWGTFQDLITYVVFTDWVFMTLAAISIFVFRVRYRHAQRPYKTWGYPVVPAIFVLISIWFIASSLISAYEHAIAGLALLGIGTIAYFAFRKWFGNSKLELLEDVSEEE